MQLRYIENVLGNILILFSVSFVAPVFYAALIGEDFKVFLIPLAFSFILGIFFVLYSRKKLFAEIVGEKEIYIAVALSWLSMVMFGSIPYIFYGIDPLDSVFESMSGFTTTGATVLIPEDLPRSLLLWRSLTQWIGGLGIIVVFLAFIPSIRKKELLQAEHPVVLLPSGIRMRDLASNILKLYLALTIIEAAILAALGVDVFDAVSHALTTLSTGGFSTHSESIAYFNDPKIELVVILFMVLGGTNFALIYALTRKDLRVVADIEFRYYLSLILIAIAIVFALNLQKFDPLSSLRFSSFQIVSLLTTTGYTTSDLNAWSDSTKMVFLLLMLVGGCSGSTAGGLKFIRSILLIKYFFFQLYRSIEPHAIRHVRLGKVVVEESILNDVLAFFVMYVFIFFFSAILISLFGYDLQTSISLAASSIGNVGPAFGEGFGCLAGLNPAVKVILIVNMWMGRLEILPVITLLVSLFERRKW